MSATFKSLDTESLWLSNKEILPSDVSFLGLEWTEVSASDSEDITISCDKLASCCWEGLWARLLSSSDSDSFKSNVSSLISASMSSSFIKSCPPPAAAVDDLFFLEITGMSSSSSISIVGWSKKTLLSSEVSSRMTSSISVGFGSESSKTLSSGFTLSGTASSYGLQYISFCSKVLFVFKASCSIFNRDSLTWLWTCSSCPSSSCSSLSDWREKRRVWSLMPTICEKPMTSSRCSSVSGHGFLWAECISSSCWQVSDTLYFSNLNSSLMSFSVKYRVGSFSFWTICLMTEFLKICLLKILSSTVPQLIKRYTITGLVCPIL